MPGRNLVHSLRPLECQNHAAAYFLFYKFIVEEDTPTGVITIAAGSALIDMVMKDIGGDASNSTADTAVSNILIAVATKQGDYVNMFHDGTSWYAECMSSTNDSFTTS